MKSIKMTYRGFCFNVNPDSVKAEFSRAHSTALIFGKRAKPKEICELPSKISGSGKFVGENAREFMQSFYSVYKKGGAAYLFSPVFPPVKAFFTRLDFSIGAGGECINYTFEFIESQNEKKGAFDFGYTLAEEGENLFDISNRTGISVEKIFNLNGFETPFSVEEGDRVWLK